jgi:hypothetical protein
MSALRIQDIVAKTAGVSLKNTTRVLRTLAGVLDVLEEGDAAATLEQYLIRSAHYDLMAAPLHSKPCQKAIVACESISDRIEDEMGREWKYAIHELYRDPYYEVAMDCQREKRAA